MTAPGRCGNSPDRAGSVDLYLFAQLHIDSSRSSSSSTMPWLPSARLEPDAAHRRVRDLLLGAVGFGLQQLGTVVISASRCSTSARCSSGVRAEDGPWLSPRRPLAGTPANHQA